MERVALIGTNSIGYRIMVLGNGRIIEQGSHKQLMNIDGKYKHLFTLQASKYIVQTNNDSSPPLKT